MSTATTAAGRRMPVDAEPAPGGRCRLVPAGTGHHAEIVTASSEGDLRWSHHATCPQGQQWRRGGGR